MSVALGCEVLSNGTRLHAFEAVAWEARNASTPPQRSYPSSLFKLTLSISSALSSRPETMSLPPHTAQATASHKTAWRAPTSLRNISNPYNLAIPPKSQRRSKNERADTPTVYLDPPEPSSETLQSQNSSRVLEVPNPPKKAVFIIEKPIQPGPYSGDTTSRSSTYTPTNQHVPEERKRRVDDRVLAFAVTFTLAILLAIGIPLGVILPQKYIKPLPINVLVPFYVNPEAGAWGRLYDT
jgi:hypothetical protein